jgi:hypothetical protein
MITADIATGRRSTSVPPSTISAPQHRRLAGREGRSNSPQSVFDAIMREARASLETIKNRLAATGSHAKGHGEAHRAVDGAIHEIRLALEVR